jgi:transposase
MPAERTTMRQVREVLRLKFVGGVATREIARRIGVAASTVRVTLKRFRAAGLPLFTNWRLMQGRFRVPPLKAHPS